MRTLLVCGLFFFSLIPKNYCQVITLNVTTINPSCGYNNGSIMITASGGTAPYGYSLGGDFQNNGYFPGINAYGNGIYEITVTDAAGNIATTQVKLTDVLPPPAGVIQNVVRPTTCTSSDGQITVVGSGGVPPYEYSFDGINYSSNNVFQNLTEGMYYFFVRDANGCVAKTGHGFLGEFTALNNCGLYCNGEGGETACTNDGNLDIVAVGGTPPYLYSMDGINFQSSIFLNNSLTFTNLTSGLYHLWAKDANGVIAIAGFQLIQRCDVYVVYIGVDASCDQNDGSITITANKGIPPYTYTIDGVNYQTSNVFGGLRKGFYSVSVKDAAGGIYSRQVVVYDKCPTVSIIGTDEICGQKNGTITATGLKGTQPYAYSIDGINFQTGNIFTGLDAGNYTITLKDVNGFSAAATTVVKNNCMTVSGVAGSATCGNNNGIITVMAANGTVPYEYSIDGIIFQNSNVFSNLKAGPYTLYATDLNGLSVSTPLIVGDAPGPQITITTTPASCQNTNGMIQIDATGGTTPLSFSKDNGATFQSGNVFNNLDSGQYLAVAKDANGCAVSTAVHLTALLSPVFSLGNDTTLCNGQSLLLSVPISAGNQYLWQDNSTSNQYSVSAAGTYSLTITNQSGCSVSKSVKVNFTSMPVFNLGRDTVLCDVEPLTLQPAPVLPGDYLWSTGDQTTSLPVTASGTYWLTISEHGCSARQSIHVFFKPTPVFNLGADTTLCEGQSLFFDITTANSLYTWQDGSSGPTYTVIKPGRYSAQVDENGCGTASSVVVSYTSKPALTSWTDTSVCASQKILLDASYPQSTYMWQDGSASPTFSVQQEGIYSVSVTNICGTATNTIKVLSVQCDCDFFLPNAFTPNQDGHNDLFLANHGCLFTDFEMKIFNRWGQMVFSSGNISDGWDGKMQGRPQPVGVYVWMLNYRSMLTGKKMSKSGTVMLIR